MQTALQWLQKANQDDSDPLTAVVGEHLAARTKEQIEQDRDFRFNEFPLKSGGSEPDERGPRRGPTDLLVGSGLAIFGRLSDALESFLDTPPHLQIDDKEPSMAKQPKQPSIEQRTEQQQRGQEAEQAAYRKQELEAYLQQRDRERHHDRGR
jgi:hypothetical protein